MALATTELGTLKGVEDEKKKREHIMAERSKKGTVKVSDLCSHTRAKTNIQLLGSQYWLFFEQQPQLPLSSH
jgi:hypothetical protein